MLTHRDGNDITDASDASGEITAKVFVDDVSDNARNSQFVANVILAIYDREGFLVSVSTVEADLSDMNYVFSHTVEIPEDVSVGSIKLMIWNSLSDMSPLSAVSSIL